MIRIADYVFNTVPNYHAGDEGADIEVLIPDSAALSDDDITAIKNATVLEELEVSYGEVTGVIATYNLVGWKAIEKKGGTRFRWQTYRTTDLEALKQDNEDLTQALLELAEIVGGGNG